MIVITYQGTSALNPVTGKTGTDAFERYDYWRNGHEVVLTLSGPAGADNVPSPTAGEQSALAAIYMDPTQVGHAPIATALLGFYLAHGVNVMMLLRMLALKAS